LSVYPSGNQSVRQLKTPAANSDKRAASAPASDSGQLTFASLVD
jgi:hypothetical protein